MSRPLQKTSTAGSAAPTRPCRTEYLDTPGVAGSYRYGVRACAGELCSKGTSPSQNLTVTAP